jgi:hypothetical protein
MDRFIPSLLCCLHYRLESSPLQPFATTLYLHNRQWEWIIFPNELGNVLDLYQTLKMLPNRLRRFITIKLQPGNTNIRTEDHLITNLCRRLKHIAERPRFEFEWPDFLLSSVFPLQEFRYVLNRGQTSQSMKDAVFTLIVFLELVLTLSSLRVPVPALQKFCDTCMKLSRDIVIMLSYYQHFAHETFFYMMLRGSEHRYTIEREQEEYAIRRLQPDVTHFATFQI